MIKSFADKTTEALFATGKSRRISAELARRAVRKLDMVDNACHIGDLRVPPGNKLHALAGDRNGQWFISVNGQWRICFRFEEGDAYEVELCDYH